MQPESPPPAPAVVAVVVTCDPGPWFDQVLASLAAQDYPNLSVLVVDAGSSVDPTPAVAQTMPGAFVRLTGRRTGFGTAANEVLTTVEGASHYLFCHDDVVLEPDAVRLLVEEAFRSNAGIASPKYVMWDEPDHLLAVGATTDKVAAARSLVDRGELDQQQHDTVRDVLVAPGGVTLVRADLFAALGGFDEVVDQCGEDLNLSWRARLVGARVTVVPAARVRHLEATRRGLRGGRMTAAVARRTAQRTDVNRYRTVLECYRWYTLVWIMPLALVWALGEAGARILQGRAGEGWAAVAALGRAVRPPRELWEARRRIQQRRTAGDGALRQLQARGNTRMRSFVRSTVDDVRTAAPYTAVASRLAATRRGLEADSAFGEPDVDGPDTDVGPEPRPDAGSQADRAAAWRSGALIALLLLMVLIFGTRDLLTHGLPQVGRLPVVSGGWGGIWRTWWTAWQPGGLGVGAPSSPATAFLGLLSTALFGAVGTAQHLAVLGPLVLGPIGAWRAARWWGSRRGQIAAAVAYAIVPLPYNALARGHWDGLVVYAAMPWVLSVLGRLSGLVPVPFVRLGQVVPRLVGLGALVAVTAAVAPSFLYVVPIVGLAVLGGSALVGRAASTVRYAALAFGASAAAFVLLLPWSATVLASRAAVLGPDPGPAGRLGLGSVLRFHTGPFGSGAWGWLLLVAAALPLFIGRGWRLEWAARLWAVALAFFFLAWAGWRGWLPALPIEVVLAPAAAALAGSTALGAAAFELDLPGYRFGWRQAAGSAAAVALALASIPLIAASGGGRWKLPSADASAVLAFLPDAHAGDYRVLWVGSTDAVPLAGRQFHPGLAYGTSFDGEPVLADDWATGPAGAGPQLATDLNLVEQRLTTKLGHLLAPAGVRYLVVPNHMGPSGSGAAPVPVPGSLLSGLALQTDLESVDVGDPNYSVYQNGAWAPGRALLPAGARSAAAAPAAAVPRLLQATELKGSTPVLTGGSPSGVTGPVPVGARVYVASTRSSGWHLTAGNRSARATPAFGWATEFSLPAPPATGSSSATTGTVHSAAPVEAHLTYQAPFPLRAGQVVEILLWLGVAAAVLVDRRRRRPLDQEMADPSWFVPMSAGPVRPRRARVEAPEPAPDGLSGDEVWTDV